MNNYTTDPGLPSGTGVIPYQGNDCSVFNCAHYPELFIADVSAPYRKSKRRLAYESRDLLHSVSLLRQLVSNGWRVPVATHTYVDERLVGIETYIEVRTMFYFIYADVGGGKATKYNRNVKR